MHSIATDKFLSLIIKLQTLSYTNPLSSILEDFFSIRFKPHQVVVQKEPYFAMKIVLIRLKRSFFDLISRYQDIHIYVRNKTKLFFLNRTYDRNDPRHQLFRNQNKYFALRILSWSRHNFDLIYFFRKQIHTYIVCIICPTKENSRSKIWLGSEKAGLLESFLS